jgi:outer membrane immunogenic protein
MKLKSVMLVTVFAASAGVAQAADLIDVPEAPMAPVAGNWDGLYVGAFAGYGFGSFDDVDEDYPLDGGFDLSGYTAGVVAGLDMDMGNGIVAGIAADIASSGIEGVDEDYNVGGGDFTAKVNYTASLRGKLGFDQGTYLPYLTAGLALAQVEVADYLESQTKTHVGFTVGAGVEVAVSEQISLDLQYRYSNYGSQGYSLDSSIEAGISAHTLTAGLNFRF